MEALTDVLHNNPPYKKSYSDEEKLAILDSFKQSGLGGQAFCRQANISISTLYKWKKLHSQAKINPDSYDKKIKKFIPVKVVPGNIFDSVVEIKLANGIEIKFSEQTSIALIGNLVRELNNEN